MEKSAVVFPRLLHRQNSQKHLSLCRTLTNCYSGQLEKHLKTKNPRKGLNTVILSLTCGGGCVLSTKPLPGSPSTQLTTRAAHA